ncbi:SRPBCC family protein [Vulcaniibacterium tengchongense]|uniref:Uncharacterized protein YndB with AHSA1/START domain n=1 Tax=Vulcaniibacterium tengchongense TaxID=1273429 RepID=A0A3N4VFH5_9GAMM|nr:SRPBCC family protein [Vulcaniibacterium tengchongense]RPE81438.1 uncharacterized protein YndB with AHSA1/START domain [Vulcaniibacterium tengchongense]
MKITVERTVKAGRDAVWSAYSNPEDITRWNTASEDWHSPRSTVDLREGGRFSTRMEARDGSQGFDFEGTYTRVVPGDLIEYRMDDGRDVQVTFDESPQGVRVRVTFDAENVYPAEMQREGWQSILDSFGRYVEAKAGAAG